jgi:predicted RNA-binding Zn ribbon-like protein
VDSKGPAPGDLELVRQFINTHEINPAREDFEDLPALRRWLADQGLIQRGERLQDGDVKRAIEVREALRSVLSAEDPDPRDLRTLNSAADAAPLRVVFDAVASPALKPAAGGLDNALARLFAIIECASYEGTWSRLKICAADDCEWAFYDHTKNRSGAWCSMESCGNRAKGRAYRERRRVGAATRA